MCSQPFSSDVLQQETLFVLPAVWQMSQLRPRPLSRSLASIITPFGYLSWFSQEATALFLFCHVFCPAAGPHKHVNTSYTHTVDSFHFVILRGNSFHGVMSKLSKRPCPDLMNVISPSETAFFFLLDSVTSSFGGLTSHLKARMSPLNRRETLV